MAEDCKKDFYMVLGVPRSADSKGIRGAFRELAKRYHPDKSGPDGDGHFRVILEAYSVLSDSKRKELYDRELLQQTEETERGGALRQRSPWERSARRTSGRRRFPHGTLRTDSLPEGLRRTGVLHASPWERVDFEVILSREEARRGGVAEIAFPVARLCPRCGGEGGSGWSRCASCRGEGVVTTDESARILIPAGIRDRSLFEISLSPRNGENLRLRIFIRVQKTAD